MSQTKAELIDAKGDANFDSGTLYVDASTDCVGVGTTSPSSTLTVSGDIEIVGGNKTLKNSSGFLQLGTTSNDYLAFLTNNTEKAKLDTSGNLLVGVTSANANGGVLQLKSGITFPATVVESTDANTLDDYEEGTWTPELKPDGVFAAWPTSTNTGKYIKIGKQVFVECIITWTSRTTSGNYIYLTGLPFAPSATTPYNYVTVFGASSSTPYAMLITTGPVGQFIRNNALGAFGPLIGTELGNATGSLQFGITYNIV